MSRRCAAIEFGCGLACMVVTACTPVPQASSDALRIVSDAGAVPDAVVTDGGCPAEMQRIGSFCIDRYEAYVVEIRDGGERPHSPFLPVDGIAVRARSAYGIIPQGYISQVQAAQACAAAGKRLCGAEEFLRACRGPSSGALYPYLYCERSLDPATRRSRKAVGAPVIAAGLLIAAELPVDVISDLLG